MVWPAGLITRTRNARGPPSHSRYPTPILIELCNLTCVAGTDTRFKAELGGEASTSAALAMTIATRILANTERTGVAPSFDVDVTSARYWHFVHLPVIVVCMCPDHSRDEA